MSYYTDGYYERQIRESLALRGQDKIGRSNRERVLWAVRKLKERRDFMASQGMTRSGKPLPQ